MALTEQPAPELVAELARTLAAVRARITDACALCGRDPASVELVAVSKLQPVEVVRAAYAAGQRVFGENYVQELVAKADACADLTDLRWHFIGHLQRNKAKDVVRARATVETIDSIKLAEAVAERAAREGRVLDVFLQVNVAGETQKSGCAPAELLAVIEGVRAQGALRLRGLMTVPPAEGDPRPWFAQLRSLAQQHGLASLSMGMSADLETAIAEGATHVRVGTAIFGSRAHAR
jgi:pyridoxal phosphate enzyme (YggS family)